MREREDVGKGRDTWWLINVIPEVNMTTRPAHILSDLALKMRYLVIQISMSYVVEYSYLDDAK